MTKRDLLLIFFTINYFLLALVIIIFIIFQKPKGKEFLVGPIETKNLETEERPFQSPPSNLLLFVEQRREENEQVLKKYNLLEMAKSTEERNRVFVPLNPSTQTECPIIQELIFIPYFIYSKEIQTILINFYHCDDKRPAKVEGKAVFYEKFNTFYFSKIRDEGTNSLWKALWQPKKIETEDFSITPGRYPIEFDVTDQRGNRQKITHNLEIAL